MMIESLAQRPVLEVHATPLVLGPRELRAALFLPSWLRPGGEKLPVLLDPYGGPAGQKVAAMQGWLQLTSRWFAEQGFAVLVADGWAAAAVSGEQRRTLRTPRASRGS